MLGHIGLFVIKLDWYGDPVENDEVVDTEENWSKLIKLNTILELRVPW